MKGNLKNLTMKLKKKLALALCTLFIVAASCNYSKPAENPDTDGKDSIENDTTNSAVDTTQTTPADTATIN
jgi:hypothetical protein